MKKIVVFSLMCIVTSFAMHAQDKYLTKTGHVWFYSHAKIEDFEGHTHEAVSIMVPSTGKIEIALKMMSFEFRNATMQEHFNSNYMESAKFPTAKFTGNITNLSDVNFGKDGTYNATVEGEMMMHGVTQKVNTTGTIEIKDGKIITKSKFNLKPKDYGLVIESRFSDNIAEVLEINVDMTYELKK
jgi:polyisoprenoid-binding protein YceI